MKDERITYVDAMRGLAMVMVVISHCCDGCFSYKPIYNTIINHALQIPLFFFISGFFAPRLTQHNFLTATSEKLRYLVVPALLMLGLFCWIFGIDFIEAMFMSMKDGYWFTLVLFGYIVIFYTADNLVHALRLSGKGSAVFHLLVALTVSYIALGSDRFDYSYPILSLLSIKEYFSYSYFILGMLMFKHRKPIFNLLNNNNIIGGCILLTIIFQTAMTLYGTQTLGYGAGLAILCLRTVELTIIWFIFHKYSTLCATSRFGNILSLIGRRSLDVYFIHYFFLPSHLQTWGAYFAEINAPFIAYLCAIILSIPLIAASLGTGCILRLSPFTGELLLGVKRINAKQIQSANEQS